MTGYDLPDLMAFTRPMLHRDFERRPTALAVMKAFDVLVACLPEKKLNMPSSLVQ